MIKRRDYFNFLKKDIKNGDIVLFKSWSLVAKIIVLKQLKKTKDEMIYYSFVLNEFSNLANKHYSSFFREFYMDPFNAEYYKKL